MRGRFDEGGSAVMRMNVIALIGTTTILGITLLGIALEFGYF
jgi:hypothetical protein